VVRRSGSIPIETMLPTKDISAAKSTSAKIFGRCLDAGVTLAIIFPTDQRQIDTIPALHPRSLLNPARHADLVERCAKFRAGSYARRKIAPAYMTTGNGGTLSSAHWEVLAIDQGSDVVGAIAFQVSHGSEAPETFTGFRLIRTANHGAGDSSEQRFLRLIRGSAEAGLLVVEASRWAIATEYKKHPVGVALILMISAIAASLAPYRLIGLANCRSGAARILTKLGAFSSDDDTTSPLDFYHPVFAAKLRCLWIDSPQIDRRYQLTLLERERLLRRCSIVRAT
jgi:hypothetical protein